MFTKIQNFISASDFRKNLSKYFKEAKESPLIISTGRGGEVSVVLGSELYNKLVEVYEDVMDSKELTQLVHEDKGGHVSWKDVKKRHAL
jgi:PHD/YefM family antitoxin component YafN of YafNO toxin-antitoxin module